MLVMAALLFAAIPLNLSRVRDTSFLFVAAFILILLPKILPSPVLLDEDWFRMLIGVECLFALAALSVRSVSAWVLAGFCLWNALGHVFGLFAYRNSWDIYSWYEGIIRAGELSQAASLLIFSAPIINFAVLRRARRQEGDDGWFRLEHSR